MASLTRSCLRAYVAQVPALHPPPFTPPAPLFELNGWSHQGPPAGPEDWSLRSRPDKMCSAWLASQHVPNTHHGSISDLFSALQQSFWMLWMKQMWWNRAVQCLPVKCHGVELLLSIKGKDRSLKCAFNYRTFSVVVHQCWFVNRLTKPHINSERGGWMCHHQSELLAASLGGYSNNWNLSVHMLWVLIQMAFKNLSFET